MFERLLKGEIQQSLVVLGLLKVVKVVLLCGEKIASNEIIVCHLYLSLIYAYMIYIL